MTITETAHQGLVKLAESVLGGLSRYKSLKDFARADGAVVTALQQQRLTELLHHAGTRVPYYRDVLRDADAISATGEVHLDNVAKVPLLDKTGLREHYESLKSDDLGTRDWFINTSGGSTGEPTRFIQDRECKHWIRAIRMLFDEWSGRPIGSRQTFLWGSERDLFVGDETWKVRLKRWLKNEQWLNAFRMQAGNMREYAERINAFRPVQIQAYATSIYEFARFLEKHGIEVHSPKSVLTSAGTLHPHMRDTIERVFRAPVFNRYGTREVGDIASQFSPDGGLCVVDFIHYVEILRPDGTPSPPGEPGEVVVTYLANKAMPLIRYRIGDMAVRTAAPADSGPQWTTLERVVGRVTDPFLLRDGGIVTPEYLIHLVGVVLNEGWIRRYQVVQEDYDSVTVRVALSEPVERPTDVHAQKLAEISEKIRLVMGEHCALRYQFEADIPCLASGKYRYTVSKLVEQTGNT